MCGTEFVSLIKSKGFNQKRLSEATGISQGMMSHKIRGRDKWFWDEAVKVCETLDITLDDFNRCFPVGGNVKPSSPAPKTKNECICDALESLKLALTTN
uniref:Helix-turn-helix domain protein n=1 Tax=Siphoviridae sp. ct2hZ16 TaxID=2826276 RepID=A0A8S5QU67_9CAUD|nr:MAG TPA: helix-turn-helix domain protein [Siphoviridae sp. ct2hZ16]